MTDLLTFIVTSVPWWVRLILAIVCVAVGVLVLLFASVRAGVVILGAAFVFLMFAGRTDAEKNGYNF